jgi:hypothetical protein
MHVYDSEDGKEGHKQSHGSGQALIGNWLTLH